MSADELTIVAFLKGSPASYYARREIARRAVKRQVYEENPHWVDAPLRGLVDKGVVEKNDHGLYRLKQEDPLT
jgi:hypothetical protein